MKDYKHYLDKLHEIGYVNKVIHSLSYIEGIPGVKSSEVVVFENGGIGLASGGKRPFEGLHALGQAGDTRAARAPEKKKIRNGLRDRGRLEIITHFKRGVAGLHLCDPFFRIRLR